MSGLCPACGKSVANDDRTCSHCGTPLLRASPKRVSEPPRKSHTTFRAFPTTPKRFLEPTKPRAPKKDLDIRWFRRTVSRVRGFWPTHKGSLRIFVSVIVCVALVGGLTLGLYTFSRNYEVEVRGYLYHSSGTPVQGVLVIEEKTGQRYVTDRTGRFYFRVRGRIPVIHFGTQAASSSPFERFVVVPGRKAYWRSGVERYRAYTIGTAHGRVIRRGDTPFAEEDDPIPPITVVAYGTNNKKVRTTVNADGYWNLPDVMYGKPIVFRRLFSTFDPKTVVAGPAIRLIHLGFIDETLFAFIVALILNAGVLPIVVWLDKVGVINL